MGAGAYKLDKYIPGQEVRFVANENYFEGKPKKLGTLFIKLQKVIRVCNNFKREK